MKVKVTKCTANGPQFSNLTPGSEHKVIKTAYWNGTKKKKGVWVKGVGDDVVLLIGEYTEIK